MASLSICTVRWKLFSSSARNRPPSPTAVVIRLAQRDPQRLDIDLDAVPGESHGVDALPGGAWPHDRVAHVQEDGTKRARRGGEGGCEQLRGGDGLLWAELRPPGRVMGRSVAVGRGRSHPSQDLVDLGAVRDPRGVRSASAGSRILAGEVA